MHNQMDLHRRMDAFAARMHTELAAQVTHPVAEYHGARLEQLYMAMAQAQRHTSPHELRWNV